ncbi:hypothetical protein FQN50_005780 [Emmonsiellopsis sp. PD_5]|nr:hypothetical protein FQN50_005780 [Emmonsiellopsis sp. PD_5]
MSAQNQKTVVVIGGTGLFGNSVVQSLRHNPDFYVKVTTRDPSAEKAKRVIDQGIEVIKADSWNPDELAVAFKDAWAVFLNTDSDDPHFKQQLGRPEEEMGQTVIDAAIEAGIKHFVYACLPAASQITGGRVQILSFDAKNKISDYARAQTGFETTTNVNAGWALEAYWMERYCMAFGGFGTIRDNEGYLTLKVPPMGNDPELIPWTSITHDFGDVVHGVLLDPYEWNGRDVWLTSEALSFTSFTEAYNRVTGTNDARYVVEQSALNAADEFKAKEVNGLFGYCHAVKGNYCGGKPIDQTEGQELKRRGARARGATGPGVELMSVEGFIKYMIARFGNNPKPVKSF